MQQTLLTKPFEVAGETDLDLHVPAGAAGLDLITLAVEQSRGGGSYSAAALKRAHLEARELLQQARRDNAFHASLPHALQLVRDFPEDESLQITAARLVTEGGDPRQALACWRSILTRFGLSAEAFRLYVRLVLRAHNLDAATALVDERFPRMAAIKDEQELVSLGLALEELGRFAEAEHAYERAIRISPQLKVGWRRLAALQERRGAFVQAERTLADATATLADTAMRSGLARLRRTIQTLEGISPGGRIEDTPTSVAAMNAIVRKVAAARIDCPPRPSHSVGSVVILGGTLGSGGAERQLAATAIGLRNRIEAGHDHNGVPVIGPVEVCCRSLNTASNNDFFKPVLEDAGIEVGSYLGFEPYGGQIRSSGARNYCGAIELLSPRMREGVVHLVDHFRLRAPDVVHLWQDGMVLAGGLAALIAGVPRIVLSARTLPPTQRIDRARVELEPIYRALLGAPGVLLSANSRVAARGYEAWLGLPHGTVPVIYNGVNPLSAQPKQADQDKWEAFVASSGSAGPVMGGVMRLDQNKRPFDWLDVARRIHVRDPHARFILVGDGPLYDQAVEYAARMGLRRHVLFTGRSGSVGYWLSKMRALLLTSRFEGTPNVLIEAQLAGVPVVTTPAGGAAETLIEGETGFVLADAEQVDAAQAAELVCRFLNLTLAERESVAGLARRWAQRNYSVEAMLSRTLDLFTMPSIAPMLGHATPIAA